MTKYLEGCICAIVSPSDAGNLPIDLSTVTTGENYWDVARAISDRPGSMVAVWKIDNLLIPGWSDGSLDVESARQWIERCAPDLLLLRAEWDQFFQIPRGWEGRVRPGATASDS